METHSRSMAKALSWRFVALVTTGLVAWHITGQIAFGVIIGFSDSIIKLGLYYFHERAWQKVTFGRLDPALLVGEGGEGI